MENGEELDDKEMVLVTRNSSAYAMKIQMEAIEKLVIKRHPT